MAGVGLVRPGFDAITEIPSSDINSWIACIRIEVDVREIVVDTAQAYANRGLRFLPQIREQPLRVGRLFSIRSQSASQVLPGSTMTYRPVGLSPVAFLLLKERAVPANIGNHSFPTPLDIGTSELDPSNSSSPPIPLSTLRATPRDASRKTKGQDGIAVFFLAGTLSCLTTCRFIPALTD